MKLKFKKLLISLVLVTASVSALADVGSAVLGIIIGSAIVSNQHPVYVQPPPVYIYQQPTVISPSQSMMYDPALHGYCAGYQDEMYAQCLGNIKRKKMEDAYRRGYYGY